MHSFYSSHQPSGENQAVVAEVQSLQSAGVEVILFAAHTDKLEGEILYPLKAFYRVATGRGRNPLAALRDWGPDIIHVHNLFPNFGQRWVEDVDVPLVHTLHNYRPICPAATLFRDSAICTLCPDGNRWAAVRFKCYRGSRLATLPIAWGNRKGAPHNILLKRADRLVVLSERSRQLYTEAGIPPDKMVVWPNFLPDDLDPGRPKPQTYDGWLFVGRLSSEKGILRLIQRWPDRHLLRVVGDGDQRDQVEKAGQGKTIEFLGRRSRRDVIDLMSRSRSLVFPSVWYEAFPLTYVEALAAGLPVLAFEPNVVADFVKRDATGWNAKFETDMTLLLDKAVAEADTLRDHCRGVYEQIGTEASYRERALGLYQELVESERKLPDHPYGGAGQS